MPKFIIAYRGARAFESQQKGEENYARYTKWIAGLSDYIVTPDTPLMPGKVISRDGVSDSEPQNRFMGFTIIEAQGLDEAMQLAGACPFTEIGTLEVHQIVDMSK